MTQKQVAFLVMVAMLLLLAFFWWFYKPDTRLWNTLLIVDIAILFWYCFIHNDSSP